jgi:hypothetical protein
MSIISSIKKSDQSEITSENKPMQKGYVYKLTMSPKLTKLSFDFISFAQFDVLPIYMDETKKEVAIWRTVPGSKSDPIIRFDVYEHIYSSDKVSEFLDIEEQLIERSQCSKFFGPILYTVWIRDLKVLTIKKTLGSSKLFLLFINHFSFPDKMTKVKLNVQQDNQIKETMIDLLECCFKRKIEKSTGSKEIAVTKANSS